MIHIVNFSPLRHTPSHPDYYEDPIALTGITVRLNLPVRCSNARAVVAGNALQPRSAPGGGVEVTVARVPVHEVIVLEVDA
jgi:hypothetical protein